MCKMKHNSFHGFAGSQMAMHMNPESLNKQLKSNFIFRALSNLSAETLIYY
jgi:hypothetical protein